MTGGASLLDGLDKRIEDMIGIKVKIADNPVASVVNGTGKALSSVSKLEIEESSYSDARRKIVENQEMLRRR